MTDAITRAHALSNGEYSVLLTPAGGGYAALRGYALTAWAPDPTTEHAGVLCYIRDRATLAYWSLSHMPCARLGARGNARSHTNYVEQRVECQGIHAVCRIQVAAGMNAEIRSFEITNTGAVVRSLDITTFAEIALDTPAAYAAHPAFAKLFVQTDWDARRQALIAWRRPRSPEDTPLWIAQTMIGTGDFEFDSDRARFIGRTRSLAAPAALATLDPLGGSVGTVLDAAFCLRRVVELEAGESTRFDVVTLAANARSELEQLLDDWQMTEPASVSGDSAIAALALPAAWQAGICFDGFTYEWVGGAAQSAAVQTAERAAYGGFSDDGTEYVITVGSHQRPTPQPWINVLANESFGCLLSELGAGYTWAENSRENRITPWLNDAVCDPHTDALYVRDNAARAFWSVLPGPAPASADYEVRHGFGYSRFLSFANDLAMDTCVLVPRTDPVRVVRLTLTNRSSEARDLSLVNFAQLVLGGNSAQTRQNVETRYDESSHTIYAVNTSRGEFSERVAFASLVSPESARTISATGSRSTFIGVQGSLAEPAALLSSQLDGRFGRGLDPCAALQVDFTLGSGQSVEIAFLVGEAEDDRAARQCSERYRTLAAVDRAYQDVTAFWQELVGAMQVQTPARSLDLMLNGWLAYQNLACRMWARSAFYQSGGAFGFRDQLQDSSALIYLDPQITRTQILLHAAHQFAEGDVLHWWHPPTSKGIRTRFSDDLLWLPYITLFYIAHTGDRALLDEQVRFLTADQPAPDDDEIFVWPQPTRESGTLYDHCCRALDRSLTRGAHGLPLIGVGDWNDGMNRVGRQGRGESVWLGFFLFDILHDFIPVCAQRNDYERVSCYSAYLKRLERALNDGGWDGAWYRRAYYDNGEPLGSHQNDECKIDTLAQAWAVLSRAAPLQRAHTAIAAMKDQLVSEQEGIIRLLTPAFDRTPHDPGYIKGYVPGVRENGGQYTHAAIWAVRALAELNDHESAARLLEMLTPVSHTQTSAGLESYKGEPYVVAADVYGVPPHVGRAGWTWYTGSAGWLYRVILESILGFTIVNGTVMKLKPCVPREWPGFTLRYRLPTGTTYTLAVEQNGKAASSSAGWIEDGAICITIEDDGEHHEVRIELGSDVGPRYEPRSQPITAP